MITDDIIRSLDEAKNNIKDTLATGSPDNYADYKNLVGVVYGLDMAVGIVNNAIHKYLKEQEED